VDVAVKSDLSSTSIKLVFSTLTNTFKWMAYNANPTKDELTVGVAKTDRGFIHFDFDCTIDRFERNTVICPPDAALKIVGHRGRYDKAGEEIISAYIESFRQGIRILEGDIQYTKDGVPVMCHDDIINAHARNNDGTAIDGNVLISNTDYADLIANYDFGIKKGDAYKGERIPTFWEYATLAKKLGCHIMVESKSDISHEKVDEIATFLKRHQLIDSSIFNSASITLLTYVASVLPTITLQFEKGTLTQDSVDGILALKTDKNKVIYATEKNGTTPEDIIPFLDQIEIWLYTFGDQVAHKELADKYVEAGVSGLFVDNFNYMEYQAKKSANFS
jgi:glycerophosphoryl diester phosphodiesterase